MIVTIDRQPVADNREISELLNGKVGETIPIEFVPAGLSVKDPKNRKKVDLQAVGRDVTAGLVYERWTAKNAERVAKLSGGRYGYIHIPNMNDDGLEKFVRSLYSDNFDKDGLVIDVRNNGGGFTHDQVLNYLAGREHALFKQRNGGEGLVVREFDRKWTKPLVVLINERTYSDAEVLPNALRTLNLAKLVGQPTGGQVIFTYSVRLIDGIHPNAAAHRRVHDAWRGYGTASRSAGLRRRGDARSHGEGRRSAIVQGGGRAEGRRARLAAAAQRHRPAR